MQPKQALLSLVIGLSLLATATAQAQDRGEPGPYVKLGLSIGIPNFDYPALLLAQRPIGLVALPVGDLESEPGAGVGFAIAGGYRLNSWLSAEAELHWMGGGSATLTGIVAPGPGWIQAEIDYSVFGFLVDAKIHTASLIVPDRPPQQLEPYLIVGIGGGQVSSKIEKLISSNGVPAFNSVPVTLVNEELGSGGFFARFGAGFDFWLGERNGLYLDGGYVVSTNDAARGYGLIQVGAMARF